MPKGQDKGEPDKKKVAEGHPEEEETERENTEEENTEEMAEAALQQDWKAAKNSRAVHQRGTTRILNKISATEEDEELLVF